jgi:hypothetical protein
LEQSKQTITLDGQAYPLDQFSPAVQQAVGIYNAIGADLQKAQLDVVKCQSAMQSISAQIGETVKKELADKAAAETAAAPVEATVVDAEVIAAGQANA